MPGSLPGGTRLARPPEGKALSVQPATTYVSIALATHIGCPLPNFLEFEVTSWSVLISLSFIHVSHRFLDNNAPALLLSIQ